MKWLVIAVIMLAQQPAKAPEGKRVAESNSAKSAARAKGAKDNQTTTTQRAPTPAPAPAATESQRNATTANEQSRTSSQQASDEDRTTQRKLTWFTGVLAGVGVLQLVVMFLTWLVYRRQAIEMRRQRHEMRRQRHVMLRQWRAMRAQLGQMESSGEQTDRMIEQATKQVIAIEGQVELMKTAGTHTEDLARQAVKQTELTQSQLELSNRPWISIDSIVPSSDLVFDHRGYVLMLNIQLRNVGQSVAKNISNFVEITLDGIDNEIQAMGKISNILKKPIDDALQHGMLLFPKQLVVFPYPYIVTPERIKEALERGAFKHTGDLAFHLVVCTNYRSTFEPARDHQTQCVYYIGRIDRQRGGAIMGNFRPGTSYNMKDIVINYVGRGADAY